MKRTFDLLLAIILIVILSVPFFIVAIVIRLSSDGPVFFSSNRVGKANRLFKMLKFRSMKLGTPIVGTHLLEDPKKALTPIGRHLRQWSIDEIPQIWNILQGDMSFVGPRPALFNQADLIALRTEKSIDRMVPGITGWAQVNGFRGKSPSNNNMKKRMEHDLWYMNNWSIWLDLYIILKTFYKMFTGPK